jgi:hypothetical protein
MLRFFRLNDPYRLLGLFGLLILFSLPVFVDSAGLTGQELKGMLVGEALRNGKQLYTQLFDSTAPVSALCFGLIDWLAGRSLLGRQLIALLIIFFHASFFAVILIRNKAYTDSTYLPALIMGALCFFSFDLLSISPELLGATFLLMAINNLFKEIEFKIQRDEIILNLGFYLGVASLCLFSFSVFYLGTLIILLVFTRITMRKYLLLTLGFALPHAGLWCYYLCSGDVAMLIQNFYLPNLTFRGSDLVSIQTLLTLLAVPLLFLALAFYKLNNEGRFTKYQSQLSQVMFLWMVIALIQVAITRALSPHSFILFVPSLAYFITHYFLLIRRKWLAEYILIFFLLAIVSVAMLARYNKISWVAFNKMFVTPPDITFQNKSLLVLKDELGYYKANTQAGGFLEWSLCSPIFDEPDYYENVILVSKAFDNNAPDVIIDPNNKMKAFFNRMPTLTKRYRREKDIYLKINN